MKITADPDKTRFDLYFAADLVHALNDAQREAQRVELDPQAVKLVIEYLARRFRLEVTP